MFNVGSVFSSDVYASYSSIALSPSGVPYIAFDSSVFLTMTVKDYPGVINSINKIAEGSMQIYPNPTSNILFVNLPQAQTGTLNLYDLTGKLVLQQEQKPNIQSAY